MKVRRTLLMCVYPALSLGMLAAPMIAGDTTQAESRVGGERRDASERQLVYDRDRKDYHDWNANENRAYHQYWEERHRAYRDYSRLNRREQSHYWSWRHSHPDHDRGN